MTRNIGIPCRPTSRAGALYLVFPLTFGGFRWNLFTLAISPSFLVLRFLALHSRFALLLLHSLLFTLLLSRLKCRARASIHIYSMYIQQVEDCKGRTARTGQPEGDSSNGTAIRRRPDRDSRNGKAEQDRQNWIDASTFSHLFFFGLRALFGLCAREREKKAWAPSSANKKLLLLHSFDDRLSLYRYVVLLSKSTLIFFDSIDSIQ